MKILFFADTHNAEKAPRSRTDSYMEVILNKQEQLIKPAKECDVVIHGGDVFHKKSNISFKLWNRVAEIYREMGNLKIVVGNHDFAHSPSELEDNHMAALSKLPNIDMILWGTATYQNVYFVFYGGGDFFSFKELEAFIEKVKPKEVPRIKVGVFHCSIKISDDLHYPFPTWFSPEVLSNFDLLLLGHLHDQQFVGMRNEIGVAAPGAISRGVLKEDETFDRPVGYSLVEIDDTINLGQLKKLDYKPAEEVFNVEEREEKKKTEELAQDLVEFVDKMESPKVLKSEHLIGKIKKLDIDEKVKKRAIEIIEDLL